MTRPSRFPRAGPVRYTLMSFPIIGRSREPAAPVIHPADEIRVPSFDGTELHVHRRWPRVEVDRPAPTIVCCNGVGVSTFFWTYLESYFAHRGHRVITWDYRGHNRSGHPADETSFTIENAARDLGCALDALEEADPVVVVGHSMGCQVSLEFGGRNPGRTAAIVPMLGTAGRALDTFFNSPRAARTLFSVVSKAVARWPGAARGFNARLAASRVAPLGARALGIVDGWRMPESALEAYLEHFSRMDPAVFFGFAASLDAHDAMEFVDEIVAPTLVVAGERDLFTPMRCSEELAAALPNGELFVVRDGSHACLVEQPDLINGRVADFLARHDLLGARAVLTRDEAAAPAPPPPADATTTKETPPTIVGAIAPPSALSHRSNAGRASG